MDKLLSSTPRAVGRAETGPVASRGHWNRRLPLIDRERYYFAPTGH